MTNFVLMLTRDDVTVPDAHAILELALAAGTEHIGFKDIGLPRDGWPHWLTPSTPQAATLTSRSAHPLNAGVVAACRELEPVSFLWAKRYAG